MFCDICLILALILFGGGIPFLIDKIFPKFFKDDAGKYGYWEIKDDELPID